MRAITRILQTCGFAVLEATTVADAIAKLPEHPDWVLLDLMLPDGCGTEVLAKIRAEGLATGICVVTGCTGARLDRARTMGAEHIFIKPVAVDRLMAVLRSRVSVPAVPT